MTLSLRDELISIADLAREQGKLKQTVFKIVKRLGIEPQKARSSSNGGQLISYITREEANRVVGHMANGHLRREIPILEEVHIEDQGVFYLLLLFSIGPSLQRAFDIGLREIVPYVEQRQPSGFGERIGKAVAIIERRGVLAFPESAPSNASNLGLLLIDGHHLDRGAIDQQIELSTADLALSALDHYRSFEQVGRRQ